MSDLDKLFDNAPEGAVELKETAETGYLRWFNEKGQAYGAYGWFPARDHFETIATRPQPEQEKDGECYAVQMKNLIKEAKANGFEIEQVDSGVNWRKIQPERKTVEDAVEWANGVWPVRDCDAIAYNPTSESFGYYESRIGLNEKWYHVCNQSEFEACVAAKAKSEPEWTHVFYGDKCKLMIDKPDADGDVVILLDNGRYSTCCGEDELVPIKPTITKAEAWDMLTKLNSKYQNMDTMTAIMTLCDEHELED